MTTPPPPRDASLIRGFIDVAVAAQREHTQAGILKVAREQLERLGLSVILCELAPGRFRILHSSANSSFLSAIRERWPDWAPDAAFSVPRGSTEGTLVEDLPGLLSRSLQKPREAFADAPRDVMLASIPVDGVPSFLFSCSGPGLDATAANAFGLLGKQLGAALDTARRLEELDRRNSELRAQAQEMALLNDVARRLAGAFEVNELLGLGGETLRRLLEAERWCVLLPDQREPGPRLNARAPRGFALTLPQESVAMTAFRERRVIQALDLRQDGSGLTAQGTRLAVPLLARDEALGVALILDRQARSFTQAEMDRALAVAGQLAQALLSARLYEALRTSNDDLKRTQRSLVNSERMAALGELSASIAHEVRNPLGVIFNSVGSLRRILKPQGDAALLINAIDEEADRLNRMVGDLLDYARPAQPSVQPVPLRPLFDEAIAAACLQAGSRADRVTAAVQVDEDAATVSADSRLLRQALVNLFLNSLQAMPREGRLEVRASRVSLEGKPYAEILVRDSGPGIPSDLVGKVFQPFFTTKATGTGLGLAVVRGIVEAHGGTIDLAQASPSAQFRIRLPLESQPG